MKNMSDAHYPKEWKCSLPCQEEKRPALSPDKIVDIAMTESLLNKYGVLARLSATEVDCISYDMHKYIESVRDEMYKMAADKTAKALGYVCAPPIERCKNDDGDGSCSYCLENAKGCYLK